MNNTKVNIIFGSLIILFLIGIFGGVKAVIKSTNEAGIYGHITECTDKMIVLNIDYMLNVATKIMDETEAYDEAEGVVALDQTPKAEDDEEAPKFFILPKSCEVIQGEVFAIQKYVGYGDDMDRTPVLTVEGTVDTSTLGTYPLTLTLKDWAGHTTTEDIEVNVVAEHSVAAEKEKTNFNTFLTNYKTENTVLGIDVSRWQEDIDYAQVKNAGCEFVIIRIGGYDDGSLYEDSYYKTNIVNAKKAGLKVGIYWHAEEGNIQEVKNNVAYMMDILDGETLDFPIAYDWEDFSGFQNYEMNINDLNNCFETFCNEVNGYGYDACLYSSRNFLENVWKNDGEHPVWLANYTSQTAYEGSYYMWQQANTGRIPGINGDVDLDIWYQQ